MGSGIKRVGEERPNGKVVGRGRMRRRKEKTQKAGALTLGW